MKVHPSSALAFLGATATTISAFVAPPQVAIVFVDDAAGGVCRSAFAATTAVSSSSAKDGGDDWHADFDPSNYVAAPVVRDYGASDDGVGGGVGGGRDRAPVRDRGDRAPRAFSPGGRGRRSDDGGGRGRGGGRGGGGRGRGGGGGGSSPSRDSRLGPNGHDYAVSSDAGPNNSKYAEERVHAMLAERLQAKFSRDYRKADSIQSALMVGGVFVDDKLKEWRADGVPYREGGGGGPPSAARYSKSTHSGSVDPSLGAGDDLVGRLVDERARFKATRQYDKADAVREGLRAKFDVLIDDRLLEWSVGGDFGEEHNAQREKFDMNSDRGYVKSVSSLDLEDDETEEYVQHHVEARATAKRERNFDAADKIRLDLAQRYDVTINDKLKLWSVGGVFEEMGGKVGKPRGVYARRGGGDLSPEDEDAISRLLADRYHAKKQRHFEAADGIRDDLSARYNVSIDDRSNEWRVDTNEYARRQPSSSSSGGGGDDDDVDDDDAGGPAETLSEGEARYIDGRLKERFDLKRLRLYGEADAIRDELMDRFGVQIDDRTKEWFVVSAEDAALSPA